MGHDYEITTEAPDYILIKSDVPTVVIQFLGGQISQEEPTVVKIDFTQEEAQKVREYLTKKPVKIDEKTRKILRVLADGDPKKLVDVDWQVDLIALKENRYAERFTKIKTEWDLIHYLPLRYIDRSNPQSVSSLKVGEWATVVGRIVNKEVNHIKKFLKLVIEDGHKQRITGTFFNQLWMDNVYFVGQDVIMYGNYSEYVRSNRGSRVAFPQISNPKIDKQENILRGGLPIIPIYPQKNQDKSFLLQRSQQALLERIVWIEDPVPEAARKKFNLISRDVAYREIHFPTSMEKLEAAKKRVAFDEFLRLQMFLHNRRTTNAEEYISIPKTETEWKEQFISSLPFNLTAGQLSVIEEIQEDLAKDYPMYRLLQGDVGSGKTEVSCTAALITAQSGQQVAVLAPTDVLAQQLFERYVKTFNNAGISELDDRIVLLKGSSTPKQKKETQEKIANGEALIIIGTHAIVQKSVVFHNLGLSIVDEQHKFGVEQRDILRQKQPNGTTPDFMSMSATPIPRATAQIVYGDMDVSILDDLPEGRFPIHTEWSTDPQAAWRRIRNQVEAGHQAYVVASLVEDSEKIENVESATQTYLQLANNVFPDMNVGLLHGQLNKKDKNAAIESFKNGDTDILVATSVIEVGINVPNATVITILDANRFGIASLHQIRGRVGRSNLPSFCYLIGDPTVPEAEERLNALVESTDGFFLAEKDLEIRGEGTLFSQIQSGSNDMALANLKEHKAELELAKLVVPVASHSKSLQYEVEVLFKNKVIQA